MIDIREEIPYLNQSTLLNYAATAPIPRFVSSVMRESCSKMEAPLGHHFYQSLGELEKTRRKLADFLGASASEIAFTQNTSSSLSAIAQAIDWNEDDQIICFRDEFPSNKFVWQFLEQRFGVKTLIVDPVPNEPIVTTIKNYNFDLSKVRLLSISPVSYRTGRLYRMSDLVEFCKQNEIISCFDAIQAIGVVDFNVHQLGVDIVASGAQKWMLGPIGCGFLYVRSELMIKLRSPLIGWCSLEYPERFEFEKQKLSDELTQFEPGLPNLFSIAGLGAILDYFQQIGFENIRNKIKENTLYLDSVLSKLGLENLRGENDLYAGIVSFKIPSHFEMRDWEKFFHDKNISITIRDQYVRISPHFFTTKSEIDIFVNALGELLGKDFSNLDSFISQTKPFEADISNESKNILILGGTGLLGSRLVKNFLDLGFNVHFQGRDLDIASELVKMYPDSAHFYPVEVSDEKNIVNFLNTLNNSNTKFFSLINCLVHMEVDELRHVDVQRLKSVFTVNVFAPYQVMNFFINNLLAKDGIGITNIISTSGRCGYPILSSYGSTQAALWTLTESLNRELLHTSYQAKVYVASAMHTKIQKKIGRTALRFFKSDGVFDYDHADITSKDIVEFVLNNQKSIKIERKNYIQVLINALYPSFIDSKIKKLWRNS